MTRLYVACLLDATGSMQQIKQQTISAFNEYFDTLRNDADLDVVASLFTFNSAEKRVLLDAEPLSNLDVLTDENYQPNHRTPLYDAMAWAVEKADEGWKRKRAKRVFVVLTDGLENASYEYDENDIHEMVTERDDWEFVYLGANQDSWAVAQKLGIQRDSTADYDPQNIAAAAGATAQATSRYASGASASMSYTDEERESMQSS